MCFVLCLKIYFWNKSELLGCKVCVVLSFPQNYGLVLNALKPTACKLTWPPPGVSQRGHRGEKWIAFTRVFLASPWSSGKHHLFCKWGGDWDSKHLVWLSSVTFPTVLLVQGTRICCAWNLGRGIWQLGACLPRVHGAKPGLGSMSAPCCGGRDNQLPCKK